MTLASIDVRLTNVEKVLAKLVTDYYEDSNPCAEIDNDLSLERKVTGLTRQVEWLREQRDKVNPILEMKDLRIAELERLLTERDATIQNQRRSINNLSADLDDMVETVDDLGQSNAELAEQRDDAVAQLIRVRQALS